MLTFASLLLALTLSVSATPIASNTTLDARASSCTGTISSLDDVASAVKCTTVVINGFTVPAGKTFELDLQSGAQVTLKGDITFGTKNWAGPLFQISGSNINFNGGGHTFNGQGEWYWDGQGGNGGVTKPHPMMKIKVSGTFTNLKVLNSPAHVYSVSNPAQLTMSKLTIDDSAGDKPNSKSGSKAAGHNTDGFDVSTNDLTIEDSTIYNQDDCIAINKGKNIVFQRNTCSGGHGISIGSISTGATVSGVTITGNTIVNNDQALRIKTKSDATGASVSGVTYSGNTASGIRKFGVIIDQSYPSTLGTPGNGVKMSGINFTGSKNSISVASGATRVAVNCGSGCSGTWDWSALSVSGGKAGKINYSGIKNFSQ
ncbi:endo-polygalacturonase PG1 [Irpex lacteus]|nr:endo-polygalacturonase PG1 [Irpex lacteus]